MVATDTMKNFTYAALLEYTGDTHEGWVEHLGRKFLDTYPQMEWLNATYEEKFGFRFVVFVNGRPKREIVKVLKQRLNNPRDQELVTGLKAVVDIARSRLEKESSR